MTVRIITLMFLEADFMVRKDRVKIRRFQRIPLKISPTQPPDGARGGPHTLTH